MIYILIDAVRNFDIYTFIFKATILPNSMNKKLLNYYFHLTFFDILHGERIMHSDKVVDKIIIS